MQKRLMTRTRTWEEYTKCSSISSQSPTSSRAVIQMKNSSNTSRLLALMTTKARIFTNSSNTLYAQTDFESSPSPKKRLWCRPQDTKNTSSSTTQPKKNESFKKPRRNTGPDFYSTDPGSIIGTRSFEMAFETFQTQEWWLLELLTELAFIRRETLGQLQDMHPEEAVTLGLLELFLKDGRTQSALQLV